MTAPRRKDGATRTRDADRRAHRLFERDALQHGVDAQAAGKLVYSFDHLVASLAHDVCRAERSGKGDPVGIRAQEDSIAEVETGKGTPFGSAVSHNIA